MDKIVYLDVEGESLTEEEFSSLINCFGTNAIYFEFDSEINRIKLTSMKK